MRATDLSNTIDHLAAYEDRVARIEVFHSFCGWGGSESWLMPAFRRNFLCAASGHAGLSGLQTSQVDLLLPFNLLRIAGQDFRVFRTI